MAGTPGIIANPEAGLLRSEIAIVIVGARDAEGLAKATGTGGEFGPVLGPAKFDAARSRHFFDS